jgi:lipid A 4'-phosphatase
MKSFFLKYQFYFWPLLFLILITPFTPYLDLLITRHFYTPDKGFVSNQIYNFFYAYGFIPADAIGILALLVFMIGFFIPSWKKVRAPALILLLSLLLGAGLIVHGLKDHWGRPRPKQVIEFGGNQSFRPYYLPNFNQTIPSKSFPCGHCSTGFYFFCFTFIGYKEKSRFIFWLGLFLALGLGSLLSLARIAQGGHFFSDVLFSALIMWFVAYECTSFMYRIVGNERRSE